MMPFDHNVFDYIAQCNFKDREIVVRRNQHGKFYIWVDSVLTQKRLNAKEIVCYLINAMENAK